MNASLVFRKREVLAAPSGAFVEMVVWHVPRPVSGSSHCFKYRLALVYEGECVLRYDNEAGKGDHKHIGEDEWPYRFGGLERLQEDFWSDVESWRKQR